MQMYEERWFVCRRGLVVWKYFQGFLSHWMSWVCLQVYDGVFTLTSPVILLFRLRQRKETSATLRTRLGHVLHPKPQQPVVWLHTAGLGEMMSCLGLLYWIQDQYPDVKILFTSTSLDAIDVGAAYLPSNVAQQLLPLDFRLALGRFVRHWNPKMLLIAESEVWPILLSQAYARSIPVFLVSARLSKGSVRGWKWMRFLFLRIARAFTKVLCQSEAEADKFCLIGVDEKKVFVTGSLKESTPSLSVCESQLQKWKMILGCRPVWVVASMHLNEEEIIINSHKQMQEQYPDLLLVLVPRRLHHNDTIVACCKKYGLSHCFLSAGDKPDKTTQVFVADSFGELGLWYRLSVIVLVAGSLLEKCRGHNAFEPARLGCVVLHGPHVSTCPSDYAYLHSSKCAIEVDSPESIVRTLISLVDENGYPSPSTLRMAEQAKRAMEVKAHSLAITVQHITPYLENFVKVQP
jgi:3-deoxy-D-manno-octulosonic-acid transferase